MKASWEHTVQKFTRKPDDGIAPRPRFTIPIEELSEFVNWYWKNRKPGGETEHVRLGQAFVNRYFPAHLPCSHAELFYAEQSAQALVIIFDSYVLPILSGDDASTLT